MSHAFAFLKLGLPERALADADEAIRRRPDWAKAHFRRAEALSQAYIEGGFGLHSRHFWPHSSPSLADA